MQLRPLHLMEAPSGLGNETVGFPIDPFKKMSGGEGHSTRALEVPTAGETDGQDLISRYLQPAEADEVWSNLLSTCTIGPVVSAKASFIANWILNGHVVGMDLKSSPTMRRPLVQNWLYSKLEVADSLEYSMLCGDFEAEVVRIWLVNCIQESIKNKG